MLTYLKGNFKTQDNGRQYEGVLLNNTLNLQGLTYYNGVTSVVERALLNTSVPLGMKDKYVERHGNFVYTMAAKLLLVN
jgi:hypothetical protein